MPYFPPKPVKIHIVVTADADPDVNMSGPALDNNLDTDLGDLSVGDFVGDYHLYLNGVFLRGGTDSGTAHDYYPGTSLADGQIKFKMSLKAQGQPDQLTLVKWI